MSHSSPPPRTSRRTPHAVLLLAGLCLSCATNPATGERMLSLISEGQEVQMGLEYASQVDATMPLLADPNLQNYVESVGQELAATSERPELPWSFKIIDDPAINAFALPGGPIYVTRGILTYFESEAELAAVLGHEIGHVTARHSVEQLSRQQLAGLGLIAGSILSEDVARYAGVLSQGVQVLFLSYGRDDERESDRLGVRYANRAGYDVREAVTMHEKLGRRAAVEGRSGIPPWLSTHPSPEDRVQRLEAIIDTIPTATLEDQELGRATYLDRIDGIVFGENPREGYFRDDLFLHPDLRFELRFPRGWRTQNLTSAVTALSPQQDAIVQLTLARSGVSHDRAAREFLNQRGIQVGRVNRERVNGLPATLASFRAQSQQGFIDGIVAFIEYRNRTYRVLGMTGRGRLRAYEGEFVRAIRSFDRLTDRAALNAQPLRIDIRTLSSATTIEQLAGRENPPVTIEQLAIINGVDPDETIAAGTRIKWVVGRNPR